MRSTSTSTSNFEIVYLMFLKFSSVYLDLFQLKLWKTNNKKIAQLEHCYIKEKLAVILN